MQSSYEGYVFNFIVLFFAANPLKIHVRTRPNISKHQNTWLFPRSSLFIFNLHMSPLVVHYTICAHPAGQFVLHWSLKFSSLLCKILLSNVFLNKQKFSHTPPLFYIFHKNDNKRQCGLQNRFCCRRKINFPIISTVLEVYFLRKRFCAPLVVLSQWIVFFSVLLFQNIRTFIVWLFRWCNNG